MALRGHSRLVTLAFFGCSDDDDEPTSQGSTPEAESARDRDTSTTSAADERIAQDLQLRLEDFPTRWQENDDNDDEEGQEGEILLTDAVTADSRETLDGYESAALTAELPALAQS